MLILHFTPYLIQYFYNSKTWGDWKKRASDMETTSKNKLK